MVGMDVGAGNKVFPDVGISYQVLIGLVCLVNVGDWPTQSCGEGACPRSAAQQSLSQ